jgi:hypothetical protein
MSPERTLTTTYEQTSPRSKKIRDHRQWRLKSTSTFSLFQRSESFPPTSRIICTSLVSSPISIPGLFTPYERESIQKSAVKAKEKQYQSASEHRAYSRRSGQAKAAAAGTHGVQRRAPIFLLRVDVDPFENPCVTRKVSSLILGDIAFLMKHKIGPSLGKHQQRREIYSLLNMDKDEGRWQCPILTKPFADHN